MTYVVIHYEGDIHSALKNMMKFEPIQYVSHVRVNVTALQLSPYHGELCSGQIHECSDFNDEDNKNCSLPFDMGNDRPICSNYDQGLEVVKSKLEQIQKCQKKCLQLEVNYNEKPNNILVSLVRPKYTQALIESLEDEIGYVIEMPKYANLISQTHEYSLPVALGYFGSIAGIFMGISMLSILSWLMKYMKINEHICHLSRTTIQLGMSIYLFIIFILLVNKFLKYPQDASVNFSKTTTDFSVTICSSLQIYGVVNNDTIEGKPNSYRNVHVSHDMYLMSNKSFWMKWSDPRNIIDTLNVNTGSNKIDLLDENLTTKFSFLPINDETVAACHTFQLKSIREIDSLTLIYNEEVQVYFHNTEQLLYEWDKRQNLIIPATEENVQIIGIGNSLEVYDLAITLKLEKQIKLDAEEYQSFDDCVTDYGIEALGPKLMKCFFSQDNFNCHDIVLNNSVILMNNLLKRQNKCKAPQNTLHIVEDKSSSLNRIQIRRENKDYDSDFDLTGSLGIQNYSKDDKPMIQFIFPKFTKLSQVFIFLSIY